MALTASLAGIEGVSQNWKMHIIANSITGLVAALEIWFLVLEMFLWRTPVVGKAFNLTPQFAEESAVLARNQGLYNGFLAAGLIWGLVQPVPAFAFQLKLFFLSCVLIAGIYGAVTASRRILFFQALPSLVAVVLVWVGHP